MPVERLALPLPFADAVVVVEGRLAEGGFTTEFSEEGKAGRRRWRSWVVATGATSPLGHPSVRMPAVPALVYVRLETIDRARCEVAIVWSGAPVVLELLGFPLDLGAGGRVKGALGRPAADWVART